MEDEKHPIWLTYHQTSVIMDALGHAAVEECDGGLMYKDEEYEAAWELIDALRVEHFCPAPPDDR